MKKKQTESVGSPTAPSRAEVPASDERRIPSQAIVHELTRKEGYVCSYVDSVTQQRCTSKRGLEIDHIKPWSEGGKTELSNCRLLCNLHHSRISFLKFGESSKYYRPLPE